MHSRRPHPRFAGLVALTALAIAGCSGSETETGPPRISPVPQPEVAEAMINDAPEPQMRLNACELLDLTPANVIALTGADMPPVQPTGSGELDMICTYGGPGSLERYQAELDAAATGTPEAGENGENGLDGAADEDGEADASETTETTEAEADAATPVIPEAAPGDPEPIHPDHVPDTFAAGVVKPRSGAEAALAGQPVMLGSRYGCSEVRGSAADTVENAGPGVPEAPAPVAPDLDSAYIDCTATPTGGGVEVHTVFVADNDLWHITLVRPDVPRTPEADAEALAGLHRIAAVVLS